MATDIAALGLKADSSGIVSATSDLERLTGAADKAERSADKLAGGATKAGRATRQQGEAARRAANDNRALGGQVDFATKAMRSMTRMAAGLAAALGVAFGARSVIEMADQWAQLENRVGVAIGDMEKAAAAMGRMGEIARRSFASVEQTVTSFERAAQTFQDMGRSAQQAADFTEALNLMLVAGYVEGERAASVQHALGKAMAIGSMNAVTLETVLGNSAQVSRALADELGTTVSNLRTLASQGKITSDVIANAITRRLEDMRDVVAQMPWTLGGARQAFQTEFQIMVASLSKAADSTTFMAQTVKWMADNIHQVTATVAVAAAVMTAAYAPALLRVLGLTNMLIAATTTLRGVLLTTGVGALVVGLGYLIGLFLELTEKTGSFSTAWEAMGELAGLVLEGIKKSADALPKGLEAVWATLRAGFIRLIADLSKRWADFLHGVASAARDVPGMESVSLTLSEAAIRAGSKVYELRAAADEAAQGAANLRGEVRDLISNAFEPARKKLEELRALTTGGTFEFKSPGMPSITDPLADALSGGKKGSVDKAAREAERLARAYDNMIARGEEFVARQRMEQRTVGLTAEAANRLRHEFDFLADAQRNGIDLTPQQTARLRDLAGQMAATEERTSRLREAFDFTKDTVGGFLEDFRRGLQDGESIWRAFANAATSAIDKVVDRLMNQLLDAIFEVNNAASGGGGGFLGQVLGMVGGLFGAASMGSGAGHNVGSGIGPGMGGVYAKGGVVSGAGISAYSGSVVSQPTLFPFAKGVGLMGEAGPEAILPLKRGPGGRLGVEAGGGGGVHVEEHIHNYGGQEVTTNTRDMGDGRIFREVIIGTLNEDIANRGPVSRNMEGAWGLKRGGVG